jgi:DNA repair protein RadC
MTKATVLECRDSAMISDPISQRAREEAIIGEALAILRRRTTRANYDRIGRPADVRNMLILKYAEAKKEDFGVLWLDVKNRIIAREVLSTGTVTQCSVYPREVVRAAMRLNASAAILFHCHPSGDKEPSQADKLLTTNLKNTLGLIDVRVLDHIIVAGADAFSFAEPVRTGSARYLWSSV